MEPEVGARVPAGLEPTRAFGRGSVSLGIYVYGGADQQDPGTRVDTMLEMARRAEELGFDGVTASEHHRGREGYMPNPLQLADWYLGQSTRLWAAPCPLVLPLRVPVVLAEEIAWLAARYPGRVGATFAAGADDQDFRAVGIPFEDRVAAYEAGLSTVGDLLSGRGGLAAGDVAVARSGEQRVPLATGAMTKAGVRRAVRCGVGVAFGRQMWSRSSGVDDPLRTLLSVYDEAGGVGPRIFTAQVFVGTAPDATGAGLAARAVLGPGPSGLATSGGTRHETVGTNPDAIVADLLDAWDAGMECFNLRVPYNGVSVSLALEQIHAIGELVLPSLRAELAGRPFIGSPPDRCTAR
jgi:alkanesulfonate monooxygenase SsuD/methylene tetrahydromethanopterin reductase-like flavin-dependent oxidoreductase (luciferase family)